MEIDEICALAKKAGLSYGQYVFLHREELKAAGRKRARKKTRPCLCCGRLFEPAVRWQRYCGSVCRVLAWKKRQEGLW